MTIEEEIDTPFAKSFTMLNTTIDAAKHKIRNT